MAGILETIFYSSPIVFFFSSYALHFILLLLKSYFQFYEIQNEDTIKYILSELGKYSSKRTENDKPTGLIIGFWYFCYTKENIGKDSDKQLYLFCTKNMYKKIVQKVKKNDKLQENNDKNIMIEHWVKVEKDWCSSYKKTLFDVTNFIPKKEQESIISDIKTRYFENQNKLITIIHGKPGCGKSYIGFLLSKELNGSFCRTYNPTKAFDNLRNLYSDIEPSKDKPLIIILDEIYIIFKNIKNGIKSKYNECPREVIDKESWNRLCDDIQLGIYPNTIIIGTMNEIPENIDNSLIRENRVNILYNMDGVFRKLPQPSVSPPEIMRKAPTTFGKSGENIKPKKFRNIRISKFFNKIRNYIKNYIRNDSK